MAPKRSRCDRVCFLCSLRLLAGLQGELANKGWKRGCPATPLSGDGNVASRPWEWGTPHLGLAPRLFQPPAPKRSRIRWTGGCEPHPPWEEGPLPTRGTCSRLFPWSSFIRSHPRVQLAYADPVTPGRGPVGGGRQNQRRGHPCAQGAREDQCLCPP